MPLDLLDLSSQVREMGEQLARRRADVQRRLELLEAMLADYRDRWEELADLAESVQERVAVCEVVIQGGAGDARRRCHPLQARRGIGGDQLGGRLEDPLDVAPRIGPDRALA